MEKVEVTEVRPALLRIVFALEANSPTLTFVEVEDANGCSQCSGKWEKVGEYWHLVLSLPEEAVKRVERLEAALAESVERERKLTDGLAAAVGAMECVKQEILENIKTLKKAKVVLAECNEERVFAEKARARAESALLCCRHNYESLIATCKSLQAQCDEDCGKAKETKMCEGFCGGHVPEGYKYCPGCQKGVAVLHQTVLRSAQEKSAELEKERDEWRVKAELYAQALVRVDGGVSGADIAAMLHNLRSRSEGGE